MVLSVVASISRLEAALLMVPFQSLRFKPAAHGAHDSSGKYFQQTMPNPPGQYKLRQVMIIAERRISLAWRRLTEEHGVWMIQFAVGLGTVRCWAVILTLLDASRCLAVSFAGAR